MKKILFLAACVAAMSSCSNEESAAPEIAQGDQVVSFVAGAGFTRSGIDAAAMKSYWSANDSIAIIRASDDKQAPASKFKSTAAEGDQTAVFTGSINADEKGYIAIHPYIGGGAWGTASIGLTKVQHPTATSLDPKCDILWAKSEGYTLHFQRKVATINLILKNAPASIGGEAVTSVNFASTTGGFTGGYTSMSLADGTITPNDYSAMGFGEPVYKEIEAQYSAENAYVIDGTKNTMLAAYASEIEAGSTITITVKTAHFNIVKTATVENAIKLEANKVTTFNVDLSSAKATVGGTDASDIDDPTDGGSYDI